MAIYFHLTALNLDLDDPRAPLSDGEIWGPALRYWKRVLSRDDLWERLLLRTQGQVDSAMLGAFPAALRSLLPAALAGINAQAALTYAERGLPARATQHSDLVMGLHNDPAEGRRLLESCAASCARRLDARIAAGRRAAEAGVDGLIPAVLALLAGCEAELRIIEAFCGAGSPRSRELCQGLTACALEVLVAYQRKTQDNRGSLPLFLHLLDKPATPELLQRASEAFEVVYSNALVSGRLREGEPASDSACRLLAGCLLPSERILNFSTEARALYRERLGRLLARLADQASSNPLAADLGARALASAARLLSPSSVTPSATTSTSSAPTGVPMAPAPFVLETSGCQLSIGAEGISLNGHRVPLHELVGLRHGLAVAPAQGGAPAAPLVAWSTVHEAWELDFAALGARPEDVLPLYTAVVFALDCFVRPALTRTLLSWLHAGETVTVGELSLQRHGLRTGPTEESPVLPFSQLLAAQDGASLYLSSPPPQPFSATLDCSTVWNASIIAQVIDTLAGDLETSANDRARIPSPSPRT